ncbi:MAG TPA: hypothetical protein VHX88_08885 [Solirubrobacteraceae bacterium]|nr:hypothetical protein [Solirubrobacteraceae bacterium]
MYHGSLDPPARRTERLHLAAAVGLALVGIALVAVVLTGSWHVLRSSSTGGAAPPPVVVVTPTPQAGASLAPTTAGVRTLPAVDTAAVSAAPPVAQTPPGALIGRTHISAAWEAGFYPLYTTAARTFDLNWLLIASVHRQETAFSTAPGTYHGLNFLDCCGGPMQFNVTNGPVTTWDLVRNAYRFASRPVHYDHETSSHPSIYDDFDSVMAAAWLLYSDGAGPALDGSAWLAAYAYYGASPAGVTYADQVLARAIGWSQHGFCINCGLDTGLVAAVDAAYGAPVRAQLLAEAAAQAQARRAERRRRRALRSKANAG